MKLPTESTRALAMHIRVPTKTASTFHWQHAANLKKIPWNDILSNFQIHHDEFFKAHFYVINVSEVVSIRFSWFFVDLQDHPRPISFSEEKYFQKHRRKLIRFIEFFEFAESDGILF
jgi:hypothetical protein